MPNVTFTISSEKLAILKEVYGVSTSAELKEKFRQMIINDEFMYRRAEAFRIAREAQQPKIDPIVLEGIEKDDTLLT